MPENKEEIAIIIELLEKQLALQLYQLNVPQGKIASMLNKSKTWVNAFLQSIPREGGKDASTKKK